MFLLAPKIGTDLPILSENFLGEFSIHKDAIMSKIQKDILSRNTFTAKMPLIRLTAPGQKIIGLSVPKMGPNSAVIQNIFKLVSSLYQISLYRYNNPFK